MLTLMMMDSDNSGGGGGGGGGVYQFISTLKPTDIYCQ
jgi:hypothetical protein